MREIQTLIALAVVVIAVAAIFVWRLAPRQSPYQAAKESLEVQPSPIRHPELTAALIDRIRKLEETFAEVYPATLDEWLDGFKRDENPEREIAIWEQMASAYVQFLNTGEFNTSARREMLGLLLTRSSTTDIEPLLGNLQYLTKDQARSLLALYDAAPQPVTVGKDVSGSAPKP